MTINKLKEIIFPIAVELSLDKVILFGSYARGEETGLRATVHNPC